MLQQAELSPNVPDVVPDYVDLDIRPQARVEKPEPAPPVRPPEMVGEPPEYMDLECVHRLNAELAPAPAADAVEAAAGADPEIDNDNTVAGQEDFPAAPDAAAMAEEFGETDGHRAGECIPNTPDVAPEFVAEELARPAAAVREAPPKLEEAIKSASPSWMRWGYAAAVLVAAVLGILLVGQAISTLALAATLPAWAQYLLLVPFAACCLAVAAAGVSLVRAWFKLREVRQVDVAALDEIRRRAQSRKDGVEHFQAARGELRNYLLDYPLDGDRVRRLREAGVGPELLEVLDREREYLLARTTDSHSWLDEFYEQFQRRLDKAAAARVNGWSLKAAGCVIASPLPLLDAALIVGIVMKMIRDLCHIYNVRATRSSTLILLNKAIIVAFIAGVTEDAAAMAGDMASDELSSLFGETAMGAAGAGFARVVAPKLGEGAVNAFFVRRLGRAVIKLLQPLRP